MIAMNKEILRLAIPNILSNISVPLLSSVDTALMGRFSEIHIGAVGVGAMIFNFIYWNFGFLRMGTTGITAQNFGKGDKTGLVDTLCRALLIGGIIALALILLQKPLEVISIQLMNVEGEQFRLVAEYFYIRIWAAPATLALYALMGWFFGMQNAVYPMILTICINLFNIVISYWLIYSCGMDVAGVAWGTVAAQYLGLVMGFGLLAFRYGMLFKYFSKKAILHASNLKAFLKINGDIFIRTLCLTLVFAFFYSQSVKNGEMVLAVNVILLQFVNWLSFGIDGFAFASESLVGKYYGKGDIGRLQKSIRLSFVWGMVLGLFFSLLYWMKGVEILQLFTNQTLVFEASTPYLFWVILFPIVSVPCYIWDGVFIGLTASKSMRSAMLMAFVFFIFLFYVFNMGSSNHLLWLSLILFMAARGVIQTVFYWRKGLALE